jgi:hypothetical protein
MTIRALTEAEIAEVSAMGGTRGTAARFTARGGGFNPVTGEISRRGVNVINLPVFWDLSRAQAERVAELTGSNLHYQDVDRDQAERDAIRERQIAEHRETVKANGAVCRCGYCRAA